MFIHAHKGPSVAPYLVEGCHLLQGEGIGYDQTTAGRGIGRTAGLLRDKKETPAIDGAILCGHPQRFAGILPPESPIDPTSVGREEVDRTVVPAIPILIDQKEALRVIDGGLFVGLHRHGPGIVGATAVGLLVEKQIGSAGLQTGGIYIGLDRSAVGLLFETAPHPGLGLRRRIPVVLLIGTGPAVVVAGSRGEETRSLVFGIGAVAAHNERDGILAVQVEAEAVDRISALTASERKEPRVGLHHLVEHSNDGSLDGTPIAPGQRLGRPSVVPGNHQRHLGIALAGPTGNIGQRVGPDERKQAARPGGQKEYIAFHLFYLFF